jgi:hypothetical protein
LKKGNNPLEDTVLPFHKRPAKKTDDLAEDLATGDIYEVIKAPHAMAALRAPKSQFPSAPSNRPRVFNNHYPDEVTTLMPAKGFDAFPAPPVPAPPPSRTFVKSRTPTRSVATKYQGYQRPSTQTNYRPMAGMPVTSLAPIPAPPNSLAPMAMPSDSSGSIPGTVITARAKRIGSPTMSWSAALVAMGIFAGLVTAVVARGDGDALLDATASFVDPGHSAAPTQAPTQFAAAVQAPMAPMALTSPAMATPVLPAPSAVIPPTVLLANIPVMSAKPRTAPVAFAAPPAKREVAKVAPPAAKPVAPPVAAPKAEKPVVAAAAPKASKKAVVKGDLDAEAANALAQAQLAQSL